MSDGRSLAFYAVAGIIGFGFLGLVREVRRYPMEAESAGKQVRDRLGSSVVNPESDDLAEPSIYRDWPMVQKGYQSLREMNYNDDFDAEGKVRRHALDRFTKKRKPSRDSFRQRGRRSALKSMFANEAELKKGKVRAITGGDVKLRKLKKDKDLKPEDAIERLEISAESAYFIDVIVHNGHYWGDGAVEYDRIGPFADKSSAKKKLDRMLDSEAEEWEYHFEDQGPFTYELANDGYMTLKPANMSLEDFQYKHSMPTDKSIYDYDGMIYEAKILPVQMMSAEELMFNDWSKQEMMTHGDDDSFEDWLEHEIENHGNITLREWGDDEEKSHLERYGAEDSEDTITMILHFTDKPDEEYTFPRNDLIFFMYNNQTNNLDDFFFEQTGNLSMADGLMIEPHISYNEAVIEAERMLDESNAETFNAAVYRGRKPVSELGYAERAVMMDKMIEQARIEQSLLELEAAIKMGLITEDEIMKQLSEKFGSE